MNFSLHGFRKSLLAFLTVSAVGTAAMGAEKITINDNPYPSFQAIKFMLKILFEERLGYEVETKPAENAAVWASMHEGKGDIDIHADTWLPNQQAFYDKYVVEAGTVSYSKKPYHGFGGFCVPLYFYEEQNVKSIFDLARPEIAAQLDKDGDGKGEVWIGRSGWVSTNENMVKIRDYGLSESIEWVRAEVGVNQAALADATKKHEGYATFCAKPDSVWQAYDLVQLSEPENDGSRNPRLPAPALRSRCKWRGRIPWRIELRWQPN